MEEMRKKQRRWFFAVLYAATILAFAAYFVFFSENNAKTHRELNAKIASLRQRVAETRAQATNDYTYEQLCADSVLMERYAREKLNMHRPDEDVFVIVYGQ